MESVLSVREEYRLESAHIEAWIRDLAEKVDGSDEIVYMREGEFTEYVNALFRSPPKPFDFIDFPVRKEESDEVVMMEIEFQWGEEIPRVYEAGFIIECYYDLSDSEGLFGYNPYVEYMEEIFTVVEGMFLESIEDIR